MRSNAVSTLHDFGNYENYLQRELYDLVKDDLSIFNFIQDSALDGLWIWDLENSDNEWMSPKFWNSLGYSKEEVPHRALFWQSIINQDDLKESKELLKKHIEDPSYPYDHVMRYKHKLGHIIYLRCRGMLIRDEEGEAIRLLGAHIDVTKLVKTKDQLKKQVERYKHIIEGTNLGTWEWNIQTGEVVFNEQWAETMGYSLIELSPISVDTWMRSLHPHDLSIFNKALGDHFEGKKEFIDCEVRMQHRNGSWVWVHNKGKVVSRSGTGEPEWIIGSHNIITKSKEQIDIQKVFIENAPSAIAMFDREMKYIAHSKKWLSDYNIKKENVIGKSHYKIFPEIGEEWKKLHQRCLHGEVIKSDDDCFVRADGSKQWLSWEIRPWHVSSGAIGGIIMLTNDKTKQKEAELRTKISEKKFRQSFTNAAIGMAIVGLDGAWVEVNSSICEILGYSEVELRQRTFQEITHPDDLDKDLKLVHQLLEKEIPFYHLEKRYINKSGEIIHVHLSVSLIRDEEEKPLYFISQLKDITARVKAQKKLHETVYQLEAILDSSSQVSMITTDTTGMITSFNRGAENLLGYHKEELIGKHSPKIIHDAKEVTARAQELSVELNTPVDGFEVFVAKAKKEGHETREWTYVKKDGTHFPVQLTVTAMKDNDEIVGFLGIAADISELKSIQKEMNQLIEVTSNQNERLKNFAHIVSHNLRSHASNFRMLMELFNLEDSKEQLMEQYQLLENASYNLKETVDHLSEVVVMNTDEDIKLEELSLHQFVDKTVKGMQGLADRAKVTVDNSVSKDLKVKAVPAYLDSIILNLLSNALRYRSEDRESFVSFHTQRQNDYIILNVEDNGLGIDLKKHQAKIFGMYKTFHKHADSRGLGLFMTKNQVEAMDGKIEVVSKVNVGTVFKVYLKDAKN
ncbi:PAS domain S-box protein [Aquimarina brevivitae]|uniref:histidine kinase n=1 Tax=Aquimarina brevivitae TaxID=323412 RepID=A0A4Q7PLG7_9FLAO|nr:PAS domain S-box protein [Aquimarina brevivitae]RZS99832.1 PAS domain S-box-containing protein [Aquimarina brevivitae]